MPWFDIGCWLFVVAGFGAAQQLGLNSRPLMFGTAGLLPELLDLRGFHGCSSAVQSGSESFEQGVAKRRHDEAKG